jgi:type IX secretion system PorP/SprF family membrane protein
MKKLILIFLFAGLCGGLYSQQQPQFNMYMFNKSALNPAGSGVTGAICVNGYGRSQWMGYQDQAENSVNPRTFGLAFDMPVYAIKSGAGLLVQYDMIGYERNLDVKLNYAFHQVFENNHMLSVGLSLDIQNKSIDFAQLYPSEPDPSITGTGVESATMTDFGLGVHYRIPRKFYAGLSVANLLGSSAEIGGPEYKLARHYYLMSGYDIQLEDKHYRPIVVTPGVLLKATGGAVDLDINAIVTYNNFLWGGLVYRVENAIGVMAGVSYYGFSVGLSYDYTMSKNFAAGSRSSMEVFVKYCYPIFPGVVKKSGYNTRNL